MFVKFIWITNDCRIPGYIGKQRQPAGTADSASGLHFGHMGNMETAYMCWLEIQSKKKKLKKYINTGSGKGEGK